MNTPHPPPPTPPPPPHPHPPTSTTTPSPPPPPPPHTHEYDRSAPGHSKHRQSTNRGRIWRSNNNYMYTKVYDVITHPCPNFNCGLAKPPLKLGQGWVINILQKTLDVIINPSCHRDPQRITYCQSFFFHQMPPYYVKYTPAILHSLFACVEFIVVSFPPILSICLRVASLVLGNYALVPLPLRNMTHIIPLIYKEAMI